MVWVLLCLATFPSVAFADSEYRVGVGSYRSGEYAEAAKDRAEQRSGESFDLQTLDLDAQPLYRVVSAAYSDLASARRQIQHFRDLGFVESWLVVEQKAPPIVTAAKPPATPTDPMPTGQVETPASHDLHKLQRPAEKRPRPDQGFEWPMSFSSITNLNTAINKQGTTQKLQLTFLPELEMKLGRFDFTLIGRLRYDAEDRLEPGEPSLRAVDSFTPRHFINAHTETELREFYADFSVGRSLLRIGKQQVVWGQADGLKVLDLINPQSFREFILEDFEDSRIPLWMINVELPLGPGDLQLLWVLEQTYHDLPESGALFEFTAPFARLFAGLPTGVPVTLLPPSRPDDRIADSDAGLRYSLFVGGWDLTFNYLYYYDDFPVIRSSFTPTGLLLSPVYERSHLYGGTASKPFGDYVLRFEYGVQTDRFFASSTPGGVSATAELATVFGIDWSGLENTLISAQFFQSTLLDDDNQFFRPTTQMNASLLLRKTFANESVAAELLIIQSLSGEGALTRAKVVFDYWTNTSIAIYADFFDGGPADLFGQFDAQDRLGIGVTLSL